MDDRIHAVIATIVASSVGGEATVIEKEDLLQAIPQETCTTQEELDGIIRELIATDYITLKYKDKDVYCVRPTEKAMVVAESSTKSLPVYAVQNSTEIGVQQYSKMYKMAFKGAFLGTFSSGIIVGGVVVLLMWLGVI